MEETNTPEQTFRSGLPRKVRIVIGAASGLLLVGGIATIVSALSQDASDEESATDDVNTTDPI